jgi:kynurenine formamidase
MNLGIPGHVLSTPIHPLQVVAMGMLVSDSLQFEDLVQVVEDEQRSEFMVVGLPLRLPGGTGSPWNPIAIF